jgi:hypothetical protein
MKYYQVFSIQVGLVLASVVYALFGSKMIALYVLGIFAALPTTDRKYLPDMGKIVSVYPELIVLYALDFARSGFKNGPVLHLLRATSGRLGPVQYIPNGDTELPPRCILLMHHRRHHHPGLTVQEFHDFAHVLKPDDKYAVITARDWGTKKDTVSLWLKTVEAKIYGSIDVRGCQGTNSCHYRLVEPFLKGIDKLVVFPDKFGSQYLGDRRMFYRDGAFAASMALGIPLVDTLSMYPSFSEDRHTFRITRTLLPPKHDRVVRDLESFNAFRKEFAADIESFRQYAQDLFFQDVNSEEAKILSCDAAVTEFGDIETQMCSRCTYTNAKDRVVCTMSTPTNK